MSDDPYAALGVKKSATQDEIKKAYRKIARESHPDLNPGDTKAEARFKAAASAFDLLKDPETRGKFDRGEIDASGQERPEHRYYREYAESPGAQYRSSRGFEDMGDFSDVFGDLFGQRARAHQQGGGTRFSARGPDAYYTLEVGFLEAALGATKRLTLPGGSTLDVKIPRGLSDGQTIRLRGKGGEGLGDGPAGDAMVTVSVAPHPLFSRDGEDIHLELPISLDEAVLGAKIEVPTIEGKVSLTVPAGASGGRVLRLRGRGVKKAGRQGDQLVSLRIVMPDRIDDGLRDYMKEWRDKHAYNPRRGVM